MGVNERGFVAVLSVTLLVLAGYFGWQQLRTIRGLVSPDVLGAGDRRYLRIQAYRRMCCSVLLAVFAGMLIGWMSLETTYRALQEEIRAARIADPASLPTEEQKDVLRFFVLYGVGALLVLMALLALAAADFWATARFGIRQHRQLLADQRKQLQAQVKQYRQERNGQQKH